MGEHSRAAVLAGERRRRPRRTWPICPVTGKQRYKQRKDAKQALEAAWHNRAGAAVRGRTSGWTVRREYQCDFCDGGWHLTSMETQYCE